MSAELEYVASLLVAVRWRSTQASFPSVWLKVQSSRLSRNQFLAWRELSLLPLQKVWLIQVELGPVKVEEARQVQEEVSSMVEEVVRTKGGTAPPWRLHSRCFSFASAGDEAQLLSVVRESRGSDEGLLAHPAIQLQAEKTFGAERIFLSNRYVLRKSTAMRSAGFMDDERI